MTIRIGTRASKLANIQANIVANKLNTLYTIVPITTSGDKETSKPLYDIGGKALFIKELEEALINNEIDIAVHSLKDMPGVLPEGLVIAATLERDDPRDSLISKHASNIKDLPQNAILGTCSPRRIAYLKNIRPDLKIISLRGNVDTRFTKVMSGELDAAILSYAGLKRIGIVPNEFCHPIEIDEIIPAIGQGTIAIETLESKKHLCDELNHPITYDAVFLERVFLKYLYADCKTPAAAYTQGRDGQLVTNFMLASEDYSKIVIDSSICDPEDAYQVGKDMAYKLKSQIT